MRAEDYIKKGNANSSKISKEGIDALKKFIAQVGGNQSASELIGVHFNTILNFISNKSGKYKTWVKIVDAINSFEASKEKAA